MATLNRGVISSLLLSVIYLGSVLYVSCSKPGPAPLCRNVLCKNEGVCNKGKCTCPMGYEGTFCDTMASAKFIGNWDVEQTTIGSDSANDRGTVVKYVATLKATATPTTFFINGFLGNPSYNELLCKLDSANSNRFVMDSISDQNMIYGIVYIMPISCGIIYTIAPDITPLPNERWMVLEYPRIEATVIIRKLTATHNWKTDTLSWVMTRHR